jgi:MFS family permease
MKPGIREQICAFAQHPLLLPIYLTSLLVITSSSLLIPVLPLFAREFSDSYGLVGLVLSGAALGKMLGDLPAGMILRRVGIKRAMQAGIFFVILSSAAPFWAGSALELLAYQVVNGFSLALYSVARHTFMAEFVTTAKRGKSISALGGVFRAGRFIGPALGGGIAAAFNLRVPFLLSAIIAGAALALISVTLRAPESKSVDQNDDERFEARLLLTLKTQYRSLFKAGAASFTLQLTRVGRVVIIPLFASDILRLSVSQIGWIESIASFVDMLLFYPAGWIMDRKGRKFAIIPSALTLSLGIALIPFTTGFGSLLVVAILIGFGNGLGSGSMMTLGADLSPPDLRGEFLGLWQLLGDGGAMTSPLIIGSVADLIVLPAASWVVCGIGIMSALLFGFIVPETNKVRRRQPIRRAASD